MKFLSFLFFFCLTTTVFSQKTYIPDANFELALLELGIDEGEPDGYISNEKASEVTSLNVSEKNINSLVGIEAFTSLEYLYCRDNALSELLLDQNTTLLGVYCEGNQISNLELSSLTNLRKLYCGNNTITTLDVGQNLQLTHLESQNNQLTSLDLLQNSELVTLNFAGNAITVIDLSNCRHLVELNCANNQLSALNLSHWNTLTDLNCSGNQIISLPLNKYGALTSLSCSNNNLELLMLSNGNNKRFKHFEATGNTSLTCIEVDDASWSIINWTAIDPQAGFNEKCYTYVPDDVFETYLQDRNWDSGPLDDYVLTATIEIQPQVTLQNLPVRDLTGIEDFRDLIRLVCTYSELTSLDVTHNDKLTYLYSYNNSGLKDLKVGDKADLVYLYAYRNLLTDIDVGTCPKLRYMYCFSNKLEELYLEGCPNIQRLYCHYNELIELDVSNNDKLTYFNARFNQLQSIDLRNGNNTAIRSYYSDNNPNLTCVNVDDPEWSYANWTNKDSWTSFDDDCYLTYVPDDDFEQALINLGLDDVLDDHVVTDDIRYIETLDLVPAYRDENLRITYLTGIEDFKALRNLFLDNHPIKEMDLSENLNLFQLRCYNYVGETILLENNIQLKWLYLRARNTTDIDLSQLINLEYLELSTSDKFLELGGNSKLKSINISGNDQMENINLGIYNKPNLFSVVIGRTKVDYVDVRNFSSLNTFWSLGNTNLEAIDLSKNNSIMSILFRDNASLHNVDLRGINFEDVYIFNLEENPLLTCVKVDDPIYVDLYKRENVDETVTFSYNCIDNLKTSQTTSTEYFSVTPTITDGVVTIAAIIPAQYSLINSNGQEVLSGTITEGTNNINLSGYPTTMYMLQLRSKSGIETVKIIKE